MGARISLLIEYLPSGGGKLDYTATGATLTSQGNNISKPSALDTAHIGGIKPFILGVSKLGTVENGGDGAYFWGDPSNGDSQLDNNGRQIGGYYNGFWGNYDYRSDSDGNLVNPLTFQIVGSGIDHFVIRFDEGLNEYAPEVFVDGARHTNASGGQFVWKGGKFDAHSVKIEKWNKPNRQVKITSILVGLTIEYDNSYFQRSGKIVAGSRSTLDNTKADYGVAPQHGSFQLFDADGNLDELSQLELLTDGLRCGVFMEAAPYDTGTSFDEYKAVNTDKMLGDFRIAEVSFVGDNVTAELTDDILNWGTIHQTGIETELNNTAYTFFTRLRDAATVSIIIDTPTTEYLQGFSMPDGFIPPSMLDAAWDTFCWATGTRISKSTGGEIWLTM